jgi:hypothetical protein
MTIAFGLALALATPAPAQDDGSESEDLAFLDYDPDAEALHPLDALIAELPSVRPNGRPIRSVHFLGIVPDPTWQGQLLHWGFVRWIDRGALEARLLESLSNRFDLDYEWDPAADAPAAQLRAFRGTPKSISQFNTALHIDAGVAVRVGIVPSWPGGLELRAILYAGRSEPGAFESFSEIVLSDGLVEFGSWNFAAIGLASLLLILAMRPLMRGSGGMVVQVPPQRMATEGDVVAEPEPCVGEGEQDGERTPAPLKAAHKAATSIHLRRREVGASAVSVDDERYNRAMVGAVTEFNRLPSGAYSVEVRRVFRDAETSDVTCIQSEDKLVVIRRRKTERVQFELSRELLMVEVEVVDGGEAVGDQGVALALRGQAGSVLYLRNGSATMDLARGRQTILIGVDDRVFERVVEVEQVFKRSHVNVDIRSDEGIVFSGCPDAVEPYLQGDLDTAIRILDEAGLGDTAHCVRAELHLSRDELREASDALELAGEPERAADVAVEAGDFAKAGRLFEEVGDCEHAAVHYRTAGDFDAAIRCFERIGDLQSAVACSFQTGDRMLAIDLLERNNAHFEAARIALELDEKDRAISLLQRVAMRDEHYGEVCVTLTQLFFQRGEPELAMQKLDEAVNEFGSDDHLELREQVALQLEERGDLDGALDGFETIRKRDIHYPGVVEKIEGLREQINAARTQAPGGFASDAPSTAPLESRYEILEEIGRGGMGIVFKARDLRLGRIVALKRLPDSLKEHPTVVSLFLREARAVAALSHPNVVTLFDADQVNGVYYLTMEFLEGMPFDAILREKGRLPVRDTLKLSHQIATGLQYAHENRIIHRDIKPANLFYTKTRQVKIMDFGLAKMVEEVRKTASVVGGTPYYMPPEQASGENVDHRTDQYALGVTMFQLLTGTLPFTDGDVQYHHRFTAPPDPREVVPGIPKALALLILRMLEKQPEGRIETTERVAQVLEKMSVQYEALLSKRATQKSE